MNEQIEKLAQTFSALLESEIGATNMRTVGLRNAAQPPESGICASHDFCDANEVMLEAFELVFGREYGGEINHEADMKLTCFAWDMAKATWRPIKAGDVCEMREAFRDDGDEAFRWVAVENEDGGRVRCKVTGVGLAIGDPIEVVEARMLRRVANGSDQEGAQ